MSNLAFVRPRHAWLQNRPKSFELSTEHKRISNLLATHHKQRVTQLGTFTFTLHINGHISLRVLRRTTAKSDYQLRRVALPLRLSVRPSALKKAAHAKRIFA